MSAARRCQEPGCTGLIAPDGYCDTCGTKAPDPAAAPKASAPVTPAASPLQTAAPAMPAGRGSGASAFAGSRGTLVTGSARSHGTRRRTGTTSTRTTSRRTAIGAGLVDVPPAPAVDPATVVIRDPTVAEDKRYCSNCGAPVGRSRAGQPGRLTGFCPKCRHPFDFVPKVRPGELVGGQYECVGCLAHGGLGWIYLARDKAVNDRWVVLKGLLDTGDEAAMAVAVAERRFLAEVQHPNIVGIFNFVTHKGAGYIVEEYVGGQSLKQLLQTRRAANGGKPDPLPVDQAIAYILAILPAFAYLHGRLLVYCDFKPDNLVQVADQVKLIDMGAVRRLDDPAGDVYGTQGYQAPEIADMGPSIASDLYTIGRTLAVLTLDFKGFQTTLQYELPSPADHPALARFDSFHRFLLKATAPHPDDRFQTAAEMADQLTGVLREVVALTTGKPEPGLSTVFGPLPDTGSLPALAVDPADRAASFLANLQAAAPAEVIRELDGAVADGRVADTVEVRLRRACALVDLGDHAGAAALLDRIEADDPWEWRAVWLRGLDALGRADFPAGAAAFDRCRNEVPGELAPRLAAAWVAEQSGNAQEAAVLYESVATVDPGYIAAVRGLARVRARSGDVDGALAAYDRIPSTHRARGEAEVEAVRMLITAGRYADAEGRLAALEVDDRRRAQLEADLYDAAIGRSNGTGGAPGPWGDERHLRRRLERALRSLADLTPDDAVRYAIVDRANAMRPVTLL